MAEATVIGIQCAEFAKASVMCSDLELAWQLQLNEALAESAAMSGVARHEGPAARRDDREGEGVDRAIAFAEQSGELLKELVDRERASKARNDVALDMQRRLHDKEFARMISEMPEAEWEDVGDNFEKPFKGKAAAEEEDEYRECNLYFSKTREDSGFVGMAWAVTDASGHVLFEQSKMLGLGVSAYVADYTALINGLAYARSAGLRNIVAHGDSSLVYNQFSGQWRARSPAQIKLLEQVKDHEKELDYLAISYVPRSKNSHVVNLAKQAIEAHLEKLRKDAQQIIIQPKEEEVREDCPICFEKTRLVEMFTVKNCSHKFCLNCLTQHVDVQVKQNLVPVRCPLECTTYLELHQCHPHLPPKVLDAFVQRLTEASVPEADRVYCPFPNCSALMSKGGLNLTKLGSSSSHPYASSIGRCECMECHRLFCVECRVPWHADLSCAEYQNLPADERNAEDFKLYQLARNQHWQRCKKCKHVIELNTGCYHMTCKCGHEFCYTCGAEWKNKQATCKCKLWDENNIINDDDEEEDDEYDDSDYDSEEDDMVYDMYYKTKICRHWVNGHCWANDHCRFAHGEGELRFF